ncbi:TonB-dependent receptor [Marinobacter sp. ATCH36]|uniref:TonB-dependent receptor domain-containing protein n=1 Tax=Marinobacter sp. ATCH36 TaxID=2945106 RepID=UPI0020214459|nr:TonB-dependent receptor [Marinobacter sp. ATCH36]MCL7942483.1 TonB-dependent receptor [Marinobacter sp. ATCH36]
MVIRHLARCIGLSMASCAVIPFVQAEPEPADPLLIRVTEGRSPEIARLNGAAVKPEPVGRLSANPSVSLSRMGGRGLDPVVRGQGQERVDVLLDGIRVEGACPNRMDPPTSRLSAALAPLLEVRTSNQTLRWGPITGGQVIATTAAPAFNNAATTGHLTLGGADNGNGKLVNGGAAVGSESGWLRLAGGYDEADDYEDGDGNEVRSAYKNAEARMDTAWRADNGFYIKGLVSRQEERDVKYAGSGMDAPKTDTDILRFELGAPVANGDWSLLAWQADVDHIMDNFSLRDANMKMLTASETQTRGLRFTLDQSPDARTDWAIGADVETNNWHAERFGGADLDMLTSVLWPDVDRDRFGVFGERFYRVTPTLQLGGGLRYDRVEMTPAAADRGFGSGMMAMSASDAYQAIYGTSNTEVTDDNFSGFASSDWRFSSVQSMAVTASHSVRSPGVTERYIASWNNMDSSKRWVGNPALDTEKHHKLELALPGRSNGWHWRPAVWVDQVDDFVLRTRNEDQVSVYRNIDARLLGLEAQLGWSNGTWSTNSSLASVRGENRDDNKALPQIPPVQFVQTLGWQYQGHAVEAEWVLARRQDRIDQESGQDPGTSPGYGVFNLTGSHPLADYLSVSWAVDNLFDNTWAPHVSRANTDPFNPEAVRVNEPGRTLRAALTARW